MTGRKCPLASRGYSRDYRSDCPQVVFGLLTDRDGRPAVVEVFPGAASCGSPADPQTVSNQVNKLRVRFGLQHVVLVGALGLSTRDTGMLTPARIRDDLAPHGIDWISALRSCDISGLRDRGTLHMGLSTSTALLSRARSRRTQR